MESQSTNPNPTPNWSNIVKQDPPQKPPNSTSTTTSSKLLQSCNSTKGIAVAIVDANAIIQGGERLHSFADKFVSVHEVISEIRDPTSRNRLSFLPFSIQTMEPSPESLKKVIGFARATGDLQTLSDVDLKLIALTYTLEAQFHGTTHLRDSPPPVHILNVRRLPEKDLPGWGDNVPNLEEWKALEGLAESNLNNSTSRILPLKDLNLNTLPDDRVSMPDSSIGNNSEVSLDLNEVDGTSRRHRRYQPKKREVKIDGKKMVADGIDASQGQCDDDAGEFRPAVSRSTHRRFLRRQARRENSEASMKNDEISEEEEEDEEEKEVCVEKSEILSILENMRLEEDDLVANEKHDEVEVEFVVTDSVIEDDDNNGSVNGGVEEVDHLDESGSVDTSSFLEDDGSEQSWMLRSLSDSSVACVTGDFAMQNVILQMGLRLLAPGGMQIRELHRWVLKCHACHHVTAEVGRIFCPKCGNGGTLRKVSATVGENGVVLAARRPRISLRGTKFSLPLPQGGRDAMSKNPILREDQVPKKYLYQKAKKKSNKDDDEHFFASSNVFTHHTDKKNSNKPPVRQALAVFSGKRNPNDNHYSRSKH